MYNKIVLIGNLTRDPEMRSTPSGVPVVRFTLAVGRPKSKGKAVATPQEESTVNGEAPTADFIPVVAWRRLAEIVHEYLRKGRPVAVEGRIQVTTFEKNGEKRIFTEVVADNIQMLGRRSDEVGITPTTSAVAEEVPF